MKVAVPQWQGRVSPVFDVAGQLLVVELVDGREVARDEIPLRTTGLDERAEHLAGLGIHTLICGAVSRPLEALVAEQGIRVLARVCGDVDEILRAFCAGALEEDRFAMPGCCGKRRRFRGRCRRWGAPPDA